MKYVSLCVILLVLMTASGYAIQGAPRGPVPRKIVGADTNAYPEQPDWTSYSNGLFYKNRAILSRTDADRSSNLDRALAYFQKAAESGQALDRVYAHIADCYFFKGDMTRSMEYARKAIEINKKELKPYSRIYAIQMKGGNTAKAAEALAEYLKVVPDSAQVEFALGEHYLKYMKDNAKAKKSFYRVLDISRLSAVDDYYNENALFYLGYIHYSENEYDKALSKFEEALSLNRNNDRVMYYLTLLYMDQYNIDGAESNALLYLNRNPGNKIIYSILGKILYLKDDPRAVAVLRNSAARSNIDGILAEGLYNELIHNDAESETILKSVTGYLPSDIAAHLALARIYERKKDATAAFNEYLTTGILMLRYKLLFPAKGNLLKAARLNPEVPGVHYYLGRCAEDLNNISSAIHYYQAAIELKPDMDLYLHIGYLHGLQKNYSRAIEYFNHAMEKEPANAKPYFFKGLMSFWKEDLSDAEKYMHKAITLDESSETYYFYYAMVMERMDKFERAVDSLKKAIRQNPQSARSLNFLGFLYADRNVMIDESYVLIQKALEIEPGNGAYIDSLGWVYYRQGHYDRALQTLLEAEDILDRAKTPDPIVYDHIGDAYLQLGKVKEAITYWNKSLTMKKDQKIEAKIRMHSKVSR